MKQDGIKNLLPAMFRQAAVTGSPLDAMFAVMEQLHERTELTLKNLDRVFDPLRTEDRFVAFLARWVDLDWIIGDEGAWGRMESPAMDTGRLRELISVAWYLSQFRGTARGLLLFLETATGVSGFSVAENLKDDQGRPRPFHIGITVPSGARDMLHLVERIVENEKPAYVTYSLALEDRAG